MSAAETLSFAAERKLAAEDALSHHKASTEPRPDRRGKMGQQTTGWAHAQMLQRGRDLIAAERIARGTTTSMGGGRFNGAAT